MWGFIGFRERRERELAGVSRFHTDVAIHGGMKLAIVMRPYGRFFLEVIGQIAQEAARRKLTRSALVELMARRMLAEMT
jgi:hypothetical protein